MARGPHRPTRLAWGSSGHRAPCHEQLENAELLQRANGLISGRPNQAPPFPTHFPHTVGEVHTASVGTHRRANEQPSRQRAQSLGAGSGGLGTPTVRVSSLPLGKVPSSYSTALSHVCSRSPLGNLSSNAAASQQVPGRQNNFKHMEPATCLTKAGA